MKPVGEMKTYPKWLWTLQEAIADKLPDGQIEVWLARLANAVVTSTDLEDCNHRFFSRLLRECLVFDREQYPECATAAAKIADLHDRWKDVDESTWSAARSAAWSAAESAAWSKIATVLIEELER